MKDSVYYRVFSALVFLCAAATLAHFGYVIYAYQHCSIIEFIAGELW